MPNTPRTPAELLAPLVGGLCFALEAQTQSFTARLARPLLGLILHRLLGLTRRIRRFVERIEAGRPFPRRRPVKPPPPEAAPRPPRRHVPDPLPRNVNWLGPLLANIVPHRAQLRLLLETPEIGAAIEAAPEQMGRALRPLCRMLGLPPPPSIASPPRRSPIRRPRPPPEVMASWPHDSRRRNRLGVYEGPPPPLACIAHLCGPLRGKNSG
jgi:hypothetical protein